MERLIAFSTLSLLASGSLICKTLPAAPAIPLRFEKGPANSFVASGIGPTATVDGAGFRMLLPRPLRVSFLNADANKLARPRQPLSLKTATFRGRTGWRSNVTTYAQVQYDAVLPGIDLLYRSDGKDLEFDFIVHPGADPNRIALRFSGHDRLRIDDGGNLVATVGNSTVTHKTPAVYQRSSRGLRLVSAAYRFDPQGDIRFDIGAYDRDSDLIIDPVVVFSAFKGGSAYDRAVAVARDANGMVYVAGNTSSGDFGATEGSYQNTRKGSQDLFVLKIDPSRPAGEALQYVTYYGGADFDEVTSMAVDRSGHVYLAGYTDSTDLPVTSPSHQSTNLGERDAFLVKLDFSPDAGSLLAYSTYFGGTGIDAAYGVAADNEGNVYVVGATSSTTIETKNQPVQSASGGGMDGFVTYFDVFGTLIYSTYLGGDRTDSARAVALAPGGELAVAMNTTSANLPVSDNAYNSTYWSGGDVYLARLAIGGNSPGIKYGTYLGGPNIDSVSRIALDSEGRIVLAGPTQSKDFPRAGASREFGGATDVFVSVLDTAQSGAASLLLSTFVGGKDHDWPYDLKVSPGGDILVTGYTFSGDFPVSSGVSSRHSGLADAFVTRLRLDAGITYSSYVGGAQNDYAHGVDVDTAGNIWLAGATSSRIFPAESGQDRGSTPGDYDAFVYALQPCGFSLSAGSNTVPAGGSSATFLVSTTSDCSWTATPSADWIRVTSGASGTGNGEVTYEVLPHGLSAERTGSVNIGGQVHSIRQQGVACTVTLEPDAVVGPGPDQRGLVIETNAPDCSWAGSTSTPWITITQNQTGTGNGMLLYAVEANPGNTERVATIVVNGVTFRLTQRGAN